MRSADFSFLIAAGGTGSRLGGEPKQFRRLCGRPLWEWSFDAANGLREEGEISDIVLVAPREYESALREKTKGYGLTVVRGGDTRALSVLNGLEKCGGSFVLVHDGARPFITRALCREIIKKARGEKCGVIPLVPVTDALKKITKESVVSVDRNCYARAQTPQAFEKEKLKRALASSDKNIADEASAWLSAGEKLCAVRGLEKNFKITTAFDWETARALADGFVETRTGHGYDVHKLVEGRPLIIAGIKIDEANLGLLGHSDADIAAHTVMDALLGAAGEPDIGTLYPASDEKWKNADSMKLLSDVVRRLASKGWRVKWVDVTLIAQEPRMGRLAPRFIASMNSVLGGEFFNIKIKSAEECGSAGRSECMICHGVATITRRAPDYE